jgi:hypothetical protein
MYEDIYNGVTPFTGCDEKSYASVQDYADSIVERYTIALDAVLDAGGQPVMATIVDFGMAPRTASAQGYSDPDKRKNVTDAVMLVNDGLKSLAAAKGLPIVNMFELFRRFVVDPEPSFVGGVSIIKEAAPNPDGRYAILPDGAHPGTVLQSLLANAFIEACNLTYATNFTPLSDQEILGAAGIKYAAGDKTFFDITPYVIVPTLTKYSGGNGVADDPYQIATAEDLMLLGDSPEDYDKHFILKADIDLDPNLPERKVFTKAVVDSFSGVFDGNGHTISHLHCSSTDRDYIGLFGCINGETAQVNDLGLIDPDIDAGAGQYVGSLVGRLGSGIISNCYVEDASVSGYKLVGGLVGQTGHASWSGVSEGIISNSYCSGTVNGYSSVGGMVGYNRIGHITLSYSAGTVSGTSEVGGLVGKSHAIITVSYSTDTVSGINAVGGLVGFNLDTVTASYSTGMVSGHKHVGGLVGQNSNSIAISYSTGRVTGYEEVGGLVGDNNGSITSSIWDIETSGQTTSAGGIGLTTVEMHSIETYLNAGWDFIHEILNGTCDYWQILPGEYPQLYWQLGDSPVMPEGLGTADQPYLIRDARDLGTVWFEPMAHYHLEEPIDLSGITWSIAVVPWFAGTFDGNGYVISNLNIQGGGYAALFGVLESATVVLDMSLEAVEINGSGHVGGLAGQSKGVISGCYVNGSISGTDYVGGIVGFNDFGNISTSYCSVVVSGERQVGGLVGWNYGDIATSYNKGSVTGDDYVGGLVGFNEGIITNCHNIASVRGHSSWNGGVGGLVGTNSGSISASYNNGDVTGDKEIGGLAGRNYNGNITMSYSTGVVTGNEDVGGLVGQNGRIVWGIIYGGSISNSYCTGSVRGTSNIGGFVGFNVDGTISACYSNGVVTADGPMGGLLAINWYGLVIDSFWDLEASGESSSAGGIGKNTVEMQTATTFLEAGWDFVDEDANGTDDIWWILEGQDYPRLWWELIQEN